ncbi:general secretion pathway protein k-like protein, partial [Plakobranchus ocellatus]
MKVNVNVCSLEDLLRIPGVGEKTAQRIVKLRDDNPFSLQSLCDLVRKDPEDLEELVSFEVLPPSHPEARRDLSDMQDTIDLCNERNASFSWHETRLKKANQHGSQNEEAGLGPSNYLDGDRRQHHSVRGSADSRGERQGRQPREDCRSRRSLDWSSARRGGEEGRSDYFDQDPVKGKRFVQPPKCLVYAGDSDWAALRLRFERFAREQVFCDQDAKDYLCWVLVGKAAEYYTLLMRQDRVMSYTELMTHMERRFAARHLRETALLRFQNARQRVDESIEEWADRIHHLALYAFEKVPGAGLWHEKDQMILRFCTGCTDRAAGLHAANMHPRSIDEATMHILKYQFNHAA